MRHIKNWNEFNLLEKVITDPKMEEEIRKFAELSNEIDRLTAQLKSKKAAFGKIETNLRPVLSELEEANENALEIDGILVTIKTRGYERTSKAYKDAFVWLYERVNPAMKKIADEALEMTEKTTYIKSKLAVQKLEETNIITSLFNKLKVFIKKTVSNLKRSNKDLSKAIKQSPL